MTDTTEDAETIVGCFREAAQLLKSVETIEQLKEREEEFLDLMDRGFSAMLPFLKLVLEMPTEERDAKKEELERIGEEREMYEKEMDVEMSRLEKLEGGPEYLDELGNKMGERIGPKMDEMAQMMMELMTGMVGGVMDAMGAAMGGVAGEMMEGLSEALDEMLEPVYTCADCGYMTLKGEPCMSCGCENKIIKCNLCLGELEDDSTHRCQACLENAQECPHCKADLKPGDLPDDCPHCGMPPKPQKTCTECECTHYRDGDLCEDCQYEADKPRCEECGEEKWSEDEYCHECYEEDHEGKLIKRIKCPGCGEKMPETEEECFACGGKLK